MVLALAAVGCGAEGTVRLLDVADDVYDAPDVAPDTALEITPVPDIAPEISAELKPPIPDSWPDLAQEVSPPPPEPGHVFEARSKSVVWADRPVPNNEATFFRTTDTLPDLDVRALLKHDATLFVATPSGVFSHEPGSALFEPVALPLEGPVVALAFAGDSLVAAHPEGVSLVSPATGESQEIAVAAGVRAVAATEARLWIATPTEVVFHPLPLSEALPESHWTGEARALLAHGDDLWIATAEGVVGPTATFTTGDGWLPDDDARALAAFSEERILVATRTGVASLGGATPEVIVAGPAPGKLAAEDNLAIAARDGAWVLGHEIGATVRRADGVTQDHYVSGRWLLDDRVPAVALGAEGRRWLGTSQGLTRIDLTPRTLAEKAAIFEEFLHEHCWRMDGFVCSDVSVADPWEISETIRRDKDNDGLWTQMQVGAWALAFGATGDETFCDHAAKAIRTMLLQIDIPAVSFAERGMSRGFVARSLVRDDEGALFDDKLPLPNWHRVAWDDGHDYVWKDDTSSDETTGHFFGYPLYFDLCADEEERAAIADRAGALAAYIIEHDFRLKDLHGGQTTHGEWFPELLAVAIDGIRPCLQAGHSADVCVGAYGGHGWLNGIEILGHMLAAWHMTGEQQFYEAYQYLIDEHRYDRLVDFHDDIWTVTEPAIANHSDHELAILGYFTLIRYEPDPARRERWIRSALEFYEWGRPERNALWAMLIAAITFEDETDVGAAAGTLHEIPLDLRSWRFDNSHRRDAKLIVRDRFERAQFDRVFPYDEIRTVWWNGNMYAVEGGSGPRRIQCPMFYLLPYWGLRYYGAIEAPEN